MYLEMLCLCVIDGRIMDGVAEGVQLSLGCLCLLALFCQATCQVSVEEIFMMIALQ